MKKNLLKKENYAFIDSQNLNLGVRSLGWRLDFRCLVEYLLKKNKLLKVVIPNKYKYSALLRKFGNLLDFLNLQKSILSQKKRHNP